LEHLPWDGDLGHLEGDIAAVAHDFRAGGLLALLLPADFDCAARRRALFADCPAFRAKIVLTRRITWFERADRRRAAPKENHAWFIWEWTMLRGGPPLVLYAPRVEVVGPRPGTVGPHNRDAQEGG
jgi:hypothetical protein